MILFQRKINWGVVHFGRKNLIDKNLILIIACYILHFVGWSLVSIFNINGIDGREDFDLLAADHDKIDWNIVVMEEHTHEFHEGDTFDANDVSYRVRNTSYEWKLSCVGVYS